MGTGGSRRSNRTNTVLQQLATVHPLKEQPVVPKQQKSKEDKIKWPMPPDEPDEIFEPKWPTDADRYSVKRAYKSKSSLSNKKFKIAEITSKQNPPQKETSLTNQWSQPNSTVHDSAHVQSSLHTESHTCVNLSTTEIDQLFGSLSTVQVHLDQTVEQDQKLISEITKVTIDSITSDTREMQQSLLRFGKTIQLMQDDLYRKWLQMYIIELDAWKSIRLAHLQDKMEMYQKMIMDYSHNLIMQVSREANSLKTNVLKLAQDQASYKTQELIEKIQMFSIHHLGTETITKMNLIIQGNVGNKMPGQGCTFNFEQTDKFEERKEHDTSDNQSKKNEHQDANRSIVRTGNNGERRTTEYHHAEHVTVSRQRETMEVRQSTNTNSPNSH